ncbi:MAG: conjugal transfer protein TraL [Clostridiales bacterium]|nr:conjugal transfer protein TraL [Clostridiales bacterium]
MMKNPISEKTFIYTLSVFIPLFTASVFLFALGLRETGFFSAALVTAVVVLLAAVFLIALWRSNCFLSPQALIVTVIAFAGLLLLRLALFDHITLDYENFLKPWLEHIKSHGGFRALSDQIGNYNIPYLAFLAFISYIPVTGLYLIKLFSVIFDVVLAFYLMKLASLYTSNRTLHIACFILALVLPTSILNGALWGQCDSVYTAFAVIALYYGLKGRPVLSVSAIAVSFSFKLQAVFILPLFLLFLISGKIKLRHLLVFPAVFFACNLPAILAGRPVWDCLTIYFNQLDTVGSGLNYNSPSVYSLFNYYHNAVFAAKLGIIAAFTLCAVVFLLAFYKRRNLNNTALLAAALIFVVGIPLFLPHMHDRYFYMADVLLVLLAVIHPVYAPLPFFGSFASLLGYHAYLKMRYFLPMRYGFLALAIVFAALFIFFIKSLKTTAHTSLSE